MATEVATLAGGCFWCLQPLFQDLKGVDKVVVGYSGGRVKNPSYEDVCTDTTGHAEAVQVTFDPATITYAEVLKVFFSVHDPTTLNRQGHDMGTQYRSAIFYGTPEQKATAEHVIEEVGASSLWDAPVVTEITPLTGVLPRGGIPSRLLCEEPVCGILPRRGRAQGREVPQGVRGPAEDVTWSGS